MAIQTFDNVELFHGCGPVRVERKKTQQPVGHASEQRIATAILRALGSWRPAVADNGNNNTVYQPMNALAPASHHSEIHHYRMPSSAPTVHSGLSVSHQASLAVSGPSNALAPRSFLPQGFQVRSASPSGAMTVASPRTPGRQSLVVAIVNETEGTSQILSRHILPSEVSPSSAGRQAPMTGDYNIAGHLGSPPERIVQGDTMYRQTPRGALLATSRSPGMDSQTA